MHSKLMLLFEASFESRDVIIGLEKVLRSNGYSHSKLNDVYNLAVSKSKELNKQEYGGMRPSFSQTGKSISKKSIGEIYKELLQVEVDKIKKDENLVSNDEYGIGSNKEEITDSDIPGSLPTVAYSDRDAPATIKDKSIRDENTIDVLKLLATNLGPMGRDKAIVLAARFDIDNELIEAAGLGALPPNYTDEDVWNILKLSANGKKKFIDSAWQPFYIEALEDIKELPGDIRDHIVELLTSSEPRDITYPSVNKDSLVDDPIRNKGVRRVYEAKLVEDLVIESADGIKIIMVGTKIMVE
jgi:hypothetical protein